MTQIRGYTAVAGLPPPSQLRFVRSFVSRARRREALFLPSSSSRVELRLTTALRTAASSKLLLCLQPLLQVQHLITSVGFELTKYMLLIATFREYRGTAEATRSPATNNINRQLVTLQNHSSTVRCRAPRIKLFVIGVARAWVCFAGDTDA